MPPDPLPPDPLPPDPLPALRGVYLRHVPDAAAPLRCSSEALRRAVQLQGFLGELRRSLAAHCDGLNAPELLVLSKGDWQALLRSPFGVPVTRVAPALRVALPAHYPERLLRGFDAVRLAAGAQGGKAPGDLREYLDLLCGLEWVTALLRTPKRRVARLDALLGEIAFALALAEADYQGMLGRYRAWSELWDHTGAARLPTGERGRLASSARLLAESRGWAALPALRALQGLPDKGSLRRALQALDPGLGAVFADPPAESGTAR